MKRETVSSKASKAVDKVKSAGAKQVREDSKVNQVAHHKVVKCECPQIPLCLF